ncbi:MAG: efflux RND transporter periplasmic adaptor subunit [Bacillota bacterium]
MSRGRFLLQSSRWVPKGVLWLTLVLLALTSAGCRSDRAEKKAPVPVTVVKAAAGRLDRSERLSGKVMAGEEVTLAPKIAGKVGAVLVDVGQEVKAGQVLLRLDAPEIEAAVQQAEAAVRVAEAGLNQAALGVERAKAALEQAQEGYRLAEANYERGKVLLEQEAISQADFETRFEQPYITAAGALKTAEAGYRQAVDQKENLAPAQLAQAQAALLAARTNRANTVVTAPISGMVASRNVDPGELASPQAPALTIVAIDPVLAEIGAAEEQISGIEVGQEVKVFIPAARAAPFSGKIKSISPAPDPRSKAYTVRVTVPNPAHLIKPGMFAEVALGAGAAAVLVPRDAVVMRNSTPVLFMVQGNKAVLRRVETGASDGRNIEVRKGLKPGERVVVSGQERLVSGTPVTVVGDNW